MFRIENIAYTILYHLSFFLYLQNMISLYLFYTTNCTVYEWLYSLFLTNNYRYERLVNTRTGTLILQNISIERTLQLVGVTSKCLVQWPTSQQN